MKDYEDKSKIKGLGEISVIMFKLTTNTLSSNSILFMNNYFSDLKLAGKLKTSRIVICEIMKLNRVDFSKLLVEMKQVFVKDIPYRVLAAVVQDNVLIIA